MVGGCILNNYAKMVEEDENFASHPFTCLLLILLLIPEANLLHWFKKKKDLQLVVLPLKRLAKFSSGGRGRSSWWGKLINKSKKGSSSVLVGGSLLL